MDSEPTDTELIARRPWVRFYDPGVPATLDYPDWTVPRMLERGAAQHPRHPAIIFFNRTLTYEELWGLARRFAAGLQRLGVKKGDRVAIYLPNTPQFVAAYYGALLAGAIVVPVNPLQVDAEVEHQLRDAGAETVVVLSRFFPLLQRVRARTAVAKVIVAEIKEYFPPVLRALYTLAREKREGDRVDTSGAAGVVSWREATRPGEPRPVELEQTDLAVLQYTGGTTGLPKGAMISHRAIICNSLMSRYWSNRDPDATQRILAVIPFFHAYGQIVSMTASAMMVGTLITLPRWETVEVLKAIQKWRPTGFHGVPTMYVAINNHPETPKYDLRSIESCICGSAPLPLEVAQKFETLTGGRLVEGFGMTEAAVATHCNPINGVRKPGSIGVPFPDVDAKIVDLETGQSELPVGEIGELMIHTPSVMKGYWQRPEETAAVLSEDGWLKTGDIARRDEDGYFYIVDRKKDMVLAGGFNVYPRDVEEVLYQYSGVREAVAVGIPDPYRGETIKAFVVMNPGAKATAEEIIAFCHDRLARYKVPTAVEFRAELPKTLIGKALRRVLREEEAAGQGRTAGDGAKSDAG